MRITILFVPALLLVGTMAACAASPVDCWALRKHGHLDDSQTCFAALTRSSEPYMRAEGFWGLGDWERANEQFRIATREPNSDPFYKVRWGLLLHERFNDPEAADLFREALEKDHSNAEAFVGLAIVTADAFDGRTLTYLAKAMELDPKLAEPHELMADLALESDERDLAAAEADKAIAREADSLKAMATHAAIELLSGRSPDPWFAKIEAINPGYGEGYSRVARQLELHYRYEDAVTYYRKAIQTSPQLWAAHSALGIELMRLGKEDEPHRELELSYNNGYRNAATVNSLRLLYSFRNFDTTHNGSVTLKLHKSEAALLRPYIERELKTIVATYEDKYKMRLSGSVQIEVYPDHEDFAVRTMGMPGLGALGVTFGQVVAMDSPSARRPGDFNWGATLWHEMSHVFILSATKQRVPRWFTEGLAVHEEGARSSEWQDRATPEVLVAIRDKKLLPIARLDRGFVYPEYPTQILVSYFQAGSICDFIKERWGEGELLEIVHSYADHQTTVQALKDNLHISSDEFDKQYLAWINAKYGNEAANLDVWRSNLRGLVVATQQKQFDAVLARGPRIIAMYPEYVDGANAYELIADAHKAKGDSKAEMAILKEYEHEGGQRPDTLERLAALEEAAGDPVEAAATLARLNYVCPVKNDALHRKLGDLLYAQKQYDGAIQEYIALVASNPVDKAGSMFSLGQAYYAAKRKDKAEEYVLAALEAAPGYRPAQKLLLELREADIPQK
jgi:cellulose synthase operon protein C